MSTSYEDYRPILTLVLTCDNFASYDRPNLRLYVSPEKTFILTQEPNFHGFVADYPRTKTEFLTKYMSWQGDDIEEFEKHLKTLKLDDYSYIRVFNKNLGLLRSFAEHSREKFKNVPTETPTEVSTVVPAVKPTKITYVFNRPNRPDGCCAMCWDYNAVATRAENANRGSSICDSCSNDLDWN